MVKCPDCGKDVPHAKFCKNCGAKLPEIIEEDNVFEEVKHQNVPKFCPSCGNQFKGNVKFCPNCGYDLLNEEDNQFKRKNVNNLPVSNEKSMLVSVILSVIFPGLGQIYLGLETKGAIFLIVYVISAVLIFAYVGLVLCLIIWILALVDVIRSTTEINEGKYVDDRFNFR